jgi:hypothetical protein
MKEQPVTRTLLVLSLAFVLQACGDRSSKPAPASAPAHTGAEVLAASTPPPDPMRAGTEQIFKNPFDVDSVYLLSQKTGTPDATAVLVKRVSQDGVQYSRWLFNCVAKTSQNLGVAENIQSLDSAANSIPSTSKPYEEKSKIGAIATAVCQ